MACEHHCGGYALHRCLVLARALCSDSARLAGALGSRLDGGSRGGSDLSKEGHCCCCCPSPFLAHRYGPPSPNHAAESRGVTHVREGRDFGMEVGMGV